MALADAAVGVNAALLQMREQQRRDAELRSQIAARLVEQRQRQQELDQRQSFQDEQLRQLADQREANASLRRENAASRLEDDLTPGDVLATSQSNILRRGGRASDVEHQDAAMGSRSYVGALPLPTEAGFDGGRILTSSQPGHEAQDVYRGNRAQRTFGRLLTALPANSRERTALEYQQATGQAPPSFLLPPPTKDPTPHFQLQPLYDDTGRPSGAIRFNQTTGDVSPVVLGGALRTMGRSVPTDDPQLPHGVQSYLLQLRAKYPTYEAAVSELARALPDLQQAHPRLDAVRSGTALRQLFAQPAGTNSLASLLAGDTGGSLSTPPPTTPPPARPTTSPAAPPRGVSEGATVTLRSGARVRVTKTYPDGTFDYEAVN